MYHLLILNVVSEVKVVTTIEASEAIASLKFLSIFLINDLQKCLVTCVSFYVGFA